MVKNTGMGDRFYVAQYDITGDTGSLDSIMGNFAMDDVTGLDKYAHERLGLLKDGKMTFTTFWNAGAVLGSEGAHTVLKALPTADIVVSYLNGTSVGNPAAVMNAKQVDYAPTRAANGSLRMKTDAMSNGYGIFWMDQLTAGKVTHASASAGSVIDYGALVGTTAFGASAVWHVFSVASGTAGGQIQHSTDNITFTAIGGMSFSGATGPTSQRLDSTALTTSINRYVKFVSTGVFTNAVIFVAFVKNLTAAT